MKTVNSIELPENSIYRLTKVRSLDPGAFSFIDTDQSATGLLHNNTLTVGRRCGVSDSLDYRNSILTSNITKITIYKKDSRNITITTQNSVYELVELDDEVDSET